MAQEVVSEADFRVLGLEPGSKPSEVKQAYRTLVKKWHPDRYHSKSYETRALAEEKFREIDEAYKRISQSWKKRTDFSHSEHGPGTKGHAVRKRPKIDFQILFRPKVVVPALLFLAAAAFIFSRPPSFSPDNAENNRFTGPRISEDSSTVEEKNLAGPTETVPQLSDHLTSPSSPALPPALLKPQPQSHNSFFTLGSTTSEVLAVQGAPSRVQGQTWIYGLSEVQFKNERVSRFNNFDGSLKVRMLPDDLGDSTPRDHISIGSSEEQVLLVQGTPTRVEGNRWYYGFAELVFKKGLVFEYDNYFGTLKMRLLPSSPPGDGPPLNVFTIGSTPDEVLAVQGTPTAIHGNRWSFDFASVQFLDGKVHSVINPHETLHFVAPEEQ